MGDVIFGSNLRKNIIIFFIVVIGIVFFGELVKMQIIENKSYSTKSENNSIKKIVQKAPRGIFFDRNYKILVSNKPSYTMQIIPAIYDTTYENLVEQKLNLTDNSIKNILFKNRGYSKYLPRVIKRNVEFEEMAWLEENNEKLKGINITVDLQRDYSFDVKGSHIFGYLREINSKQLKKNKDEYELGDFIGIKGIEKVYETYLKGKKGSEFILVDSRRKTIGKYLEGVNDVEATKGKDLVLTIDAETQKAAEKEFENYTGSLVAIEPSTGEILAYLSAPDYNLEDFASVTSSEKLNELRSNPDKPLFDRASQAIYPPGSTFKMLFSLIGLEEKLISPYTSVDCKGGFQFGNRFFKCHGYHNITNVNKAIEQSCNTFYYKLILDIGLERLHKYLTMFGFGKHTNFDLLDDSKGIAPNSSYYDRIYGKGKWTKGYLISLGIGQGEISVTTLQLAQYAALLANKGKTKVPHIGKGYLEGNTGVFHPFRFDDVIVPISERNFDIVRKGMYDVVHGDNGTAKRLKIPELKIAGKTGTSQNPHGKDHALFIAFAPYDNPKIAVAVIVENVGFGSTYAAPIAQKVIETYLKNSEEDDDLILASGEK